MLTYEVNATNLNTLTVSSAKSDLVSDDNENVNSTVRKRFGWGLIVRTKTRKRNPPVKAEGSSYSVTNASSHSHLLLNIQKNTNRLVRIFLRFRSVAIIRSRLFI